MFQQMLNGSIAVLTRPSVSTFEEHERNNLNWALIYIGIGAVITAILNVIAAAIRPPLTPEQIQQIEDQFGSTGLADSMLAAQQPPNLVGAIVGGLLSAIIGYLIYTGIVYLLGKAFGGTGQFGELAYDISLFYAPLEVFGALLGVLAIGPLACLTVVAAIAVWAYRLFLTYLGIQAGLNVPGNKALMVMVIIAVATLVLVCGLAAVVAAIIAAVAGAANQ